MNCPETRPIASKDKNGYLVADNLPAINGQLPIARTGCVRPAGHQGGHVDQYGTVWTEHYDPLALSR